MKAIFDQNKTRLIAILDDKESGFKAKVKNLKQKNKEVLIEKINSFPYFTLCDETQKSSSICFSGSDKESLKNFIKEFVTERPKLLDDNSSCDVFTLVWYHEKWESGDDTDFIGHIHVYNFSLKQEIGFYDKYIDEINEKKCYLAK